MEGFKNIDLCIFSAGTYEPKLEKEISQEQIRKTMEVNFFGVVNCIKAVEKYFKVRAQDDFKMIFIFLDAYLPVISLLPKDYVY